MNDFVMGKAQDKILGECVHHGETELVVVPLSRVGISLEVIQRIVHPAHVPLVSEAKAAVRYRMRDLRPCRGLLGDHHNVRIILRHDRIEVTDKVDRLKVIRAAVDIRNILGSSVVSVEHTGYGVHTDTVKVEFLDPEDRVTDKEGLYFCLGVIKYECAPLLMLADTRILILIAGRSVKADKTFLILREVCRDPVKDNGDAVLMQMVYEELKIRRCSETAGNRIVADYLITPGIIERMLKDRHKLNMGIAHLLTILRKVLRDLAVIHEVPVLMSLPGT